MQPSKEQRNREYVERARIHGSISLEELLFLAAGSPIDADEATKLVRESGIDLVEDGSRDPWEDLDAQVVATMVAGRWVHNPPPWG